MDAFENWESIPTNYTGHCYTTNEVRELWLVNRKNHRLDGPAERSTYYDWYFINGVCFCRVQIGHPPEEKFANHPEVIKHKTIKKLNEILSLTQLNQ